MRKIFLPLILMLLSFFCFSQTGIDTTNAKIKTVYIYNFTKYTEWTNTSNNTPFFRIGVLGNETVLVSQLNRMSGKNTGPAGHRFKILLFRTVAEITPTEILYINVENNPQTDLNKLLTKNTLLITENNRNLDNTMIAFVQQNGRQKFAVNERNIANAGLKLSPSLLQLAMTTIPKEWNSVFDKIKELIAKDNTTEVSLNLNDLTQIIETQTTQLKQIELQKNELNEKMIEITKTTRNIAEQTKILNKQKIIILTFSILSIVILILVFFLVKNIQKKKQAHLLLTEQKQIVDEKNKEILDSIHYAKRIQQALLTSDAYIKNQLLLSSPQHDFFIFYQPKDIVSGDFYWASSHRDSLFIATADCTGHGVPGAFMSLLNISFLNENVIERNLTEPARILNEQRKEIIKALNPTGTENTKDGMDCVLCKYDLGKMKLSFAAANNPVWLVRNNQLIKYKADKMPVGKFFDDELKDFSQQEIELQSGDIIYTFTDGYADQFGGPKRKKFMYKQLEETLLSAHKLPMTEQRNLLEKTINNWRSGKEQIDDMLVIGVKI